VLKILPKCYSSFCRASLLFGHGTLCDDLRCKVNVTVENLLRLYGISILILFTTYHTLIV